MRRSETIRKLMMIRDQTTNFDKNVVFHTKINDWVFITIINFFKHKTNFLRLLVPQFGSNKNGTTYNMTFLD